MHACAATPTLHHIRGFLPGSYCTETLPIMGMLLIWSPSRGPWALRHEAPLEPDQCRKAMLVHQAVPSNIGKREHTVQPRPCILEAHHVPIGLSWRHRATKRAHPRLSPSQGMLWPAFLQYIQVLQHLAGAPRCLHPPKCWLQALGIVMRWLPQLLPGQLSHCP